MNQQQAQALKQRQRALVAQQLDNHPEPIAEPAAPLRPFEEVVAESRPDVPRGVPVAFIRFTSKSMQIAGMQSGDNVKATKQPNGREHRIEYIAELRHHLITYVDPAGRKVEFDMVPESLVMTWRPA